MNVVSHSQAHPVNEGGSGGYQANSFFVVTTIDEVFSRASSNMNRHDRCLPVHVLESTHQILVTYQLLVVL